MYRVSFTDPKKVHRVPELMTEDVSVTTVGGHIQRYFPHSQYKWSLTLNMFTGYGCVTGKIHLDIRITTV